MILTAIILLLLFCLFYASYNIRLNIYVRSFCRKQTTEKIVAITFDDGPDRVQTPRVLAVLREYNAKACFFCIGCKIKGNEDIIKDILADGHMIGNHSYDHSGMFPLYSYRKMVDNLTNTQKELEQISGQEIRLFRPPFGVTNPIIGKAVRKLGYTSIGWNIRSLDTISRGCEKVVDRVMKRLKPGSVLLLHDRMPESDLLLRKLLDRIREQGYKPVGMNEMLS